MKTANQQNGDFDKSAIARLIDVRLKARLQDESQSVAPTTHLDADAVAAFVEGRLDEAQSRPMIAHLVRCASCLHITAQLIHFQPEMDEVSSASRPDEDAGPLQRFLERIAAGVLPSTTEDAVFAYQDNGESMSGDSADAQSEPSTTDPETE